MGEHVNKLVIDTKQNYALESRRISNNQTISCYFCSIPKNDKILRDPTAIIIQRQCMAESFENASTNIACFYDMVGERK